MTGVQTCALPICEVVRIIDSVGRRIWLEREGQFKIWWVAAIGVDEIEHKKRLVTYELDVNDDLVRTLDDGGAETKYAYDARHYLVTEHQPAGLSYHFEYADVAGERRCVETWGDLEDGNVLQQIGAPEASMASAPRGIHHTSFQYGPAEYETRVRDGLGNAFIYRGNALGLVEYYEDPRGQTKFLSYSVTGRVLRSVTVDGAERKTYDAMDRLTSFTDAMGRSFSLKRRDDGAIVEVRDPAGARSSFVVGGKGEALERTDPLGTTTKYEYDRRGKLVAARAPHGSTERFEYDAHGNTSARTTPRGGTTRYAYDLFGQLIRAETATGGIHELDYDSRGLLAQIRAPGGAAVEFQFDSARRRIATRHPGGATSGALYVGTLMVEEVQADGSRYRFGYDSMGRIIWVKNPAGESFTMERDSCGRVVRSTSFSGVQATYDYDLRGRPVRVETADGVVKQLTYDRCGQIVHRRDGDLVSTFAFDDRGFLRRGCRGATEVILDRDAAGRIVREEQRVGGWQYGVDRAFNTTGWVTARNYSTGWQVQTNRAHGSDIASITLECASGSERILRVVDEQGWETARIRENGYAIRTTRDATGRPLAITLEDAAGRPARERRYTWSNVGPIQEIHDSLHGRRTYELDVFGRPLKVTGLGAREQIRYDPSGTPILSEQGRVGPGGRVLRTASAAYAWDAHGRLASRQSTDPIGSWTYLYDGLDSLTQATRSDGHAIRYHYDVFGRRLGEVRNDGSSTWYGWDRGVPVEEVGSGSTAVRRVFADNEITPLLESREAGRWSSIVSDATSTPWLSVDATGATSGQDLGALGAVTRSDGLFTALRFAGQRHDEITGLTYNRCRYYSADLGTYTSPDPLGLESSAFELAFVPNVTLWIDPLGLIVLLMSDDQRCVNGANARAALTGQQIVHYSQLGNPNALAGESQLDIYGHGSPGKLHYAAPNNAFTGATMTGAQLGTSISAAGFTGNQINMTICNSGTDPPGQPGGSTAQAVANATGATTIGCVGDSMYDHPTLPGVTIAGNGGALRPFERTP